MEAREVNRKGKISSLLPCTEKVVMADGEGWKKKERENEIDLIARTHKHGGVRDGQRGPLLTKT